MVHNEYLKKIISYFSKNIDQNDFIEKYEIFKSNMSESNNEFNNINYILSCYNYNSNIRILLYCNDKMNIEIEIDIYNNICINYIKKFYIYKNIDIALLVLKNIKYIIYKYKNIKLITYEKILNNYLLCDICYYKNRICKQYKFNKLIKKRFGTILFIYIYYTYNYIYIYILYL